MKLSLETIINLSESVTSRFADLHSKQVPFNREHFYGKLYDVTFNEYGYPEIEPYKKVIEVLAKESDKPLVIAECFAGNGIESYLLAKLFPEHTFLCFDIDFSPYSRIFSLPNLHYKLLDCITPKENSFQKSSVDLIFTGALNSSNCVISSVDDFGSHIRFTKDILRKGGKAIYSFVEPTQLRENTFSVDFSTYPIKYNEKYKDFVCEWLTVTHEKPLLGQHTYYNLVILSKEGTEQVLWNEGYTIHTYLIKEVLNMAVKEGLFLDNIMNFTGECLGSDFLICCK